MEALLQASCMGAEENPLLILLSRETAATLDFWACCPVACHPGDGGGAWLAPRKEPGLRVSGVCSGDPRPKGRMVVSDCQARKPCI